MKMTHYLSKENGVKYLTYKPRTTSNLMWADLIAVEHWFLKDKKGHLTLKELGP